MNPEVRLELSGSRAVVVFDSPGRSVNTFATPAIHDFERVLDRLESLHGISGIFLVSAKPANFLSGADLDELAQLETPEQAETWLARGQAALARLETLAPPTVAAIHGAALGGGLEVALACDFRVATDDPATRLGLPEVQLGLCPALGGTWRLPRQVGWSMGLELLLSGRQLAAREAWRAGLVDEVVPPGALNAAAERWALQPPRRRGRPLRDRLWVENPLGRRLALAAAARRVREKTGGRIPAPRSILAAARAGASRGPRAAEAVERREFGPLALSTESRALVALFRAGQAARPKSVRRDPLTTPRCIGVLGAGLMGAGIARAAVRAGYPVRLLDNEAPTLGRALAAAAADAERDRRRGRIGAGEARMRMNRLQPALAPRGFGGCALVVEAIVEDEAAKRALLAEVARELPADAILASNTSTIPIARLATELPAPERVLGLHFFSPVAKMPLVEIVRHPGTTNEIVERGRAFAASLGKTPIVVGDGPGFYTSRILAPYLAVGAAAVAAGARIHTVDVAGRTAGFPVGPLTLVDEIGLDVATRAGATLHAAFPERFPPPVPFEALLGAGRAGRKSGHGFYDYRSGGRAIDSHTGAILRAAAATPGEPTAPPGTPAPRIPPSEPLADLLLYAMLAEAVQCLEDGTLASPTDGDLGAVLGLGFPPDLGGPFRFLDRVGASAASDRLARFRETTGWKLYDPPELLRDLARSGGRFHAAGGEAQPA